MAFFNSAITVLQTLVIALGAGLGIWGAINLLEGYGNDNPGEAADGGRRSRPDRYDACSPAVRFVWLIGRQNFLSGTK